jgi:rSAM/selenodomain-associated transferase 2
VIPALSIIVPTLNEGSSITAVLARLGPFQRRGAEVIVVDGGSGDATLDAARLLADRAENAPRGRASQMNAGARLARAPVLLFLHADTMLPENADSLIAAALATGGHVWGRFDVRISGRHPMLAVIARMMNLRSRVSGIATGDQAMFMRRETFEQVGGYPDIPLMEDIAFSRMLKRLERPACLSARVTTSGRRWERHGIVATMLLMWRLRLAYYFGADPAVLAKRYGYAPRD